VEAIASHDPPISTSANQKTYRRKPVPMDVDKLKSGQKRTFCRGGLSGMKPGSLYVKMDRNTKQLTTRQLSLLVFAGLRKSEDVS